MGIHKLILGYNMLYQSNTTLKILADKFYDFIQESTSSNSFSIYYKEFYLFDITLEIIIEHTRRRHVLLKHILDSICKSIIDTELFIKLDLNIPNVFIIVSDNVSDKNNKLKPPILQSSLEDTAATNNLLIILTKNCDNYITNSLRRYGNIFLSESNKCKDSDLINKNDISEIISILEKRITEKNTGNNLTNSNYIYNIYIIIKLLKIKYSIDIDNQSTIQAEIDDYNKKIQIYYLSEILKELKDEKIKYETEMVTEEVLYTNLLTTLNNFKIFYDHEHQFLDEIDILKENKKDDLVKKMNEIIEFLSSYSVEISGIPQETSGIPQEISEIDVKYMIDENHNKFKTNIALIKNEYSDIMKEYSEQKDKIKLDEAKEEQYGFKNFKRRLQKNQDDNGSNDQIFMDLFLHINEYSSRKRNILVRDKIIEIIERHIKDINTKKGGYFKNKTKPKINKKEILGKVRCIYKKTGDRKEYIKHKGELITVSEYKKMMRDKKKIVVTPKAKAKAKPKPKAQSRK
jgi:hypothetical protein